MDTTQMDRPAIEHARDGLAGRVRRASRWTTIGAAVTGAGGLAALVAGITGHGTTSSVAHPSVTLTMGYPPDQVAIVLGVTGLLVSIGLAGLGSLARAVGRGDARPGMTGARTVLAITVPLLALLALGAVCDANPLAFAGYIPFMAIGAAFSAELRQALASVPWPEMLSQLAVIGATIVTVVAGILASAALRGDAPRPDWQRPGAAARWGRIAVGAAVAVPLLYAFTRIAWVLGWSIGFDMDAYLSAGGDVTGGLVLAGGAIVGSLLTIGLVRPWGERFWSWVPGIGGRRVPVALAVVPASMVSAALLPAGVSMIVAAVNHLGVAGLTTLAESWAAIGVTFLWPLWSVALAAATWAYALRRTGQEGAVEEAA